MADLHCGEIIRHDTFGVGLVIKQQHGYDVYKHKNDYFDVVFVNDKELFRTFTNNSIEGHLEELKEGDEQMIAHTLTIEQREYFVNILKNGMKAHIGFIRISVNQAKYDEAHDKLLKLGLTDDVIDAEDVYVQMLLDGNSITLIENDGFETPYDLTLRPFLEAVNNYLYNSQVITTLDKLEEIGTLEDNDRILQYAALGDVYIEKPLISEF